MSAVKTSLGANVSVITHPSAALHPVGCGVSFWNPSAACQSCDPRALKFKRGRGGVEHRFELKVKGQGFKRVVRTNVFHVTAAVALSRFFFQDSTTCTLFSE